MEYLLHNGNEYKLYYSLDVLCKENGLDHKKLDKKMLPVSTPKGLIIGLIPNTKIKL